MQRIYKLNVTHIVDTCSVGVLDIMRLRCYIPLSPWHFSAIRHLIDLLFGL